VVEALVEVKQDFQEVLVEVEQEKVIIAVLELPMLMQVQTVLPILEVEVEVLHMIEMTVHSLVMLKMEDLV